MRFGLLLLIAPMVAHAAVSQIFLIQNSGWMQPYFADKKAQFSPIMQRLVAMNCKDNNQTAQSTLAVFNQSSKPNLSPQTLYQGSCDSMTVKELMKGVHAARSKTNPSVFANSDYRQALYRAIVRYAKGRPAIFWMVTNNKNSPGNSQKISVHDAAFYNMLHGSPEISRVIAVPLPDTAVSSYFTSHGLILFGIAYGNSAGKYLNGLVSSGMIKSTFGVPAATLKPLNISAVTFIPTGVAGPVSGVRMVNGLLRITLPARNQPQKFTITGYFKNNFYPYSISTAKTSANLRIWQHNYSVPLNPTTLTNLQPDTRSVPITLSFTVPPMPSWSLQSLLSSGRNIPAVLSFSLKDQNLKISHSFDDVMANILPNAPMPKIFQPDPSARSSRTDVPLVVHVMYQIWPLLIILTTAFVLLLSIVFFLLRLRASSDSGVQVRVQGKIVRYRLAKGSSQIVRNDDGETIATIKRSFLGYSIKSLKKGDKVEIVKK